MKVRQIGQRFHHAFLIVETFEDAQPFHLGVDGLGHLLHGPLTGRSDREAIRPSFLIANVLAKAERTADERMRLVPRLVGMMEQRGVVVGRSRKTHALLVTFHLGGQGEHHVHVATMTAQTFEADPSFLNRVRGCSLGAFHQFGREVIPAHVISQRNQAERERRVDVLHATALHEGVEQFTGLFRGDFTVHVGRLRRWGLNAPLQIERSRPPSTARLTPRMAPAAGSAR